MMKKIMEAIDNYSVGKLLGIPEITLPFYLRQQIR